MPVQKTDSFGRSWPGIPDKELCSKCGQPGSVGDCNHERLSDDDVALLKGPDEED